MTVQNMNPTSSLPHRHPELGLLLFVDLKSRMETGVFIWKSIMDGMLCWWEAPVSVKQLLGRMFVILVRERRILHCLSSLHWEGMDSTKLLEKLENSKNNEVQK